MNNHALLRARINKDVDKYKYEIAHNLIDILENDAMITDQTRTFIKCWIKLVASMKEEPFFEVWDIVLKNYLPTERPVLFRSCQTTDIHNKIVSFTRSLYSASRFSKGKEIIMACDTKQSLEMEKKFYQRGQYIHSFYPLTKVLEKAKENGGWGFSNKFFDEFLYEEEYIMRVDLEYMYCLKFVANSMQPSFLYES